MMQKRVGNGRREEGHFLEPPAAAALPFLPALLGIKV
jgi:hypothetical protein